MLAYSTLVVGLQVWRRAQRVDNSAAPYRHSAHAGIDAVRALRNTNEGGVESQDYNRLEMSTIRREEMTFEYRLTHVALLCPECPAGMTGVLVLASYAPPSKAGQQSRPRSRVKPNRACVG